MNVVLFYITHENLEAARRVVDHLLAKRLIACANLVPIQSAYWWNGEIQHAEEVVSIVKTTEACAARVEAAISTVHPYEVPCIVRIDAAANEPFARWIDEETLQK